MNKKDTLELLNIVFPWAKYMAMDLNGDWFLFSAYPVPQSQYWHTSGELHGLRKPDIDYDGKWEDSLTTLRR